MRWLKARGGPIEGFHQALLLRVRAGVREDDLIAALQAVLEHNDALRLRLTEARLTEARLTEALAGGAWGFEVAPAGAVAASGCLRRVGVCGVDEAGRRGCVAAGGAAGG